MKNNNNPETNSPENHDPTPNPFANLDQLALPQNFDSLATTVKYSCIPCRKPGKQSFVRVSPKPEHRGTFAMLEIDAGFGTDREQFLVTPELMSALADLPGLSPRMLILAVSRPESSPFVWPLKLLDSSGLKNGWNVSALDIAKQAEQDWLRVMPNMAMGCYTATVATADWPEPEWPLSLSFGEILERAFGAGNVITDLSHPAVKALRGEA